MAPYGIVHTIPLHLQYWAWAHENRSSSHQMLFMRLQTIFIRILMPRNHYWLYCLFFAIANNEATEFHSQMVTRRQGELCNVWSQLLRSIRISVNCYSNSDNCIWFPKFEYGCWKSGNGSIFNVAGCKVYAVHFALFNSCANVLVCTRSTGMGWQPMISVLFMGTGTYIVYRHKRCDYVS